MDTSPFFKSTLLNMPDMWPVWLQPWILLDPFPAALLRNQRVVSLPQQLIPNCIWQYYGHIMAMLLALFSH